MQTQPSLFISHGSPMMAIQESKTALFLKKLGRSLHKPSAIIIFSAHFDLTQDIVITAGEKPETIHDFFGFPAQLYNINYPALGSPSLAKKIAQRFRDNGLTVTLDKQRGWDHGVWVPLKLMFPEANIPIVQISINSHLGARRNYQYGQLIASFKQENILVIGSGNISHNLQELFNSTPTKNRSTMIKMFIDWINDKLSAKDIDSLLNYINEAPYVLFNHPSQEHFLPFMAALGSGDIKQAKQIHQDIENEVLAMDAYRF